MVTIMVEVEVVKAEVICGAVWLSFIERDGGQVQVCLRNLPPKIREGLIALAKEQTA